MCAFRFFLFLLSIALGVGLGLVYSWMITPPSYTNLKPDMLRTATLQSARSMGIEDRFSSISPGKTADLVVIDEDPMVDFHLIGKVVQALFTDVKLETTRCGLQVTCPYP
jgi:hypothetical protein